MRRKCEDVEMECRRKCEEVQVRERVWEEEKQKYVQEILKLKESIRRNEQSIE